MFKRLISAGIIIMCVTNTYAFAAPELNINAKSAILMEQSTGQILYEQNPDEQLPIASVTKIMTLLLICEAIDEGRITIDDNVTVSERAMSMGGSTMFLETGDVISVDEMLKGIVVASANDGAVAMAEYISGSEAEFVSKMNQRAKELGMENTQFMNTNGLDADGMRIMREVFTDIIKDGKRSIIVSSHLLGELQKVATHYGIIRHGKMIVEMTADELDASCRTYVALTSAEMNRTKMLLGCKYSRVEEDEAGYIRVYDLTTPEEIVTYLYENGICVTEIKTDKIGLEEYYIDLMKGGK